MRFVVYGPGAIGGVVGARLAQHGQDVALIARGAHYEAIRDRGLTIEWGDERATLDLPVVDDPAALKLTPDDVVLLAVKSQDTPGAVRALARATSGDVAVVSLQNGVDNERVLLRSFARVYGVCVMCPTAHLDPGVVQAFSTPTTGILDVGRVPDGPDDFAETLAATFRASTFASEARADITRWKYGKLLMNLSNSIDAACGPEARTSPLASLVRREGVAVLRAAGIDFVSKEEDAARRGDLLQLTPIAGSARTGASSWQSLARGTGSIEADYLN
ncbi:MAG: ketopantoate reductase family protein, partial [Actinobacteria bacterium]|nr:ketopantoate reductase family protein [Actinomycetota bacterium]